MNSEIIEKVIEKIKEGWNFIWYKDTLASWIFSLILIFIIIKFIFFPLLSLTLGSSMPLVVVESTSMHHSTGFFGKVLGLESNFNEWWEEKSNWYDSRGIDKEEAKEWPLNTGLEMGDIVVITGYSDLEVGDIIIFKANKRHPVIHRIVDVGDNYYETKGDNNDKQLSSEKRITEDQILGKAVFRIPKIGWVKLIMIEAGKAVGIIKT